MNVKNFERKGNEKAMKKEELMKETKELQEEVKNTSEGEICDEDSENASGGVYSSPSVKPDQIEIL